MGVSAPKPKSEMASERLPAAGGVGGSESVDEASSRRPAPQQSWMGAGAWKGARGLEILRWVYMARLGLAGGVFAAAVFMWAAAAPTKTLAATLALVVTLIHTPAASSTGKLYSTLCWSRLSLTPPEAVRVWCRRSTSS